MFAVLGDIEFEVVGSPESYESADGYDFPEQRVIESKPRLQWVGDELERLNFELMWHASFTNPASTARAVACDGSDASRTAAGVWRWRIQGILRDRIDKSEIATVVSGRRTDRDQSCACAQRMDSGRAVALQLVVTIYDAWNHYRIDRNGGERFERNHARSVGVAQYSVGDGNERSQS